MLFLFFTKFIAENALSTLAVATGSSSTSRVFDMSISFNKQD